MRVACSYRRAAKLAVATTLLTDATAALAAAPVTARSLAATEEAATVEDAKAFGECLETEVDNERRDGV